MKKVITIVLTLALILSLPVCAFAEIDLSGLSYDELVELKDRINKAIWESDTWEEVEVPYGIWIVGEDIPAGKWTITAGDGCSLNVKAGTKLNATGTELDDYDESWWLRSKTHRSYDAASDMDSVTVDMSDGLILYISEGSVIFTPYSGKPSLGFKK